MPCLHTEGRPTRARPLLPAGLDALLLASTRCRLRRPRLLRVRVSAPYGWSTIGQSWRRLLWVAGFFPVVRPHLGTPPNFLKTVSFQNYAAALLPLRLPLLLLLLVHAAVP